MKGTEGGEESQVAECDGRPVQELVPRVTRRVLVKV